MIFTCPTCSIDINVKRFPVECCQVAHDANSAAIREGELTRKKKPKAIAATGDLLSPCVFRSKESRRQWCDPCNKFLLIYDCSHFGCECAIGKTVDGARSCNGCPKKTLPPTPAVGITTAHREIETLSKCITSVVAAGWDQYHIFDDGDSSGLENATIRRPAVGCWSNWWLSFQELAMRNPNADYYLLVQDDCVFVDGVREYIERHELLKSGGVLSLYQSARYSFAETTKFTQGKAFTGAVALLFTREAANKLLASGLGISHRRIRNRGNDWIDGAIGEWCKDNDVPLHVHSPSLCQHIGTTSTIGHSEKPSRNVAISATNLTPRSSLNIGLIGWNTRSGLGTLNRAIAKHLPISSWLILPHPDFATLPDLYGVQSVHTKRPVKSEVFADFIDGLDVLLFCEQPAILKRPDALSRCKDRGIKIVCVPMIEWLDDSGQSGIGDWPAMVDLFLCPTRQCFDMMPHELRPRSVYCPWPIDTSEIEYRQRITCERFVFYHGTGGREDRKGGCIVAEAAALAPEIPLLVYSQAADGIKSHSRSEWPTWSSHVEVRGEQSTIGELYRDGDVCIQPSRMEGLGLQLIECQAAGLPLITTDGDPMREYQPFRTIAATRSQVRVHRDMPSWTADASDLARIMRETVGQDVSAASAAARELGLSRSWEAAKARVLDAIAGAIDPSADRIPHTSTAAQDRA